MYRELLVKQDLVQQLEDRVAELEESKGHNDQLLLDKYNEILQENTDLKFRVIPELERKFKDAEQRKINTLTKQLLLVGSGQHDVGDEIVTLKKQREELREVVTNLTQSHKQELRQVQEWNRQLEAKMEEYKQVNQKLSGLSDRQERRGHGKLGKLPGLAIVLPNRLFDRS